jgi:hypothetical protein
VNRQQPGPRTFRDEGEHILRPPGILASLDTAVAPELSDNEHHATPPVAMSQRGRGNVELEDRSSQKEVEPWGRYAIGALWLDQRGRAGANRDKEHTAAMMAGDGRDDLSHDVQVVDVEATDRAHTVPWLEAAGIGEGHARFPEHVTVHTGSTPVHGHHGAVNLVNERRRNVDSATVGGKDVVGFR